MLTHPTRNSRFPFKTALRESPTTYLAHKATARAPRRRGFSVSSFVFRRFVVTVAREKTIVR